MTRSRPAQLMALVLSALLGGALYAAVYPHLQPAPAPLLSSTEIGFAQDMSAHHQQAVMMSDMLAPDVAADVKALGEQIRFTQLNEIGQMTGWLQIAGAPPAGPAPMQWMMDGDASHHAGMAMTMTMPGMAAPADLKQLQRLTGPANRQLFLHLMIRHHEGGITMAAFAFRHSTNDVIRRAASVMVDEQTQEINLMSTMLNSG